MQFTSPIIMLHLKLQKVKKVSPPAEKQKGKKARGLGEGIFALLRLRLELLVRRSKAEASGNAPIELPVYRSVRTRISLGEV